MAFPFPIDSPQYRPLLLLRCFMSRRSSLPLLEVPLRMVPGGAVSIGQNPVEVALIVMRRLLLCGAEIHPQ